MPKACDLKRGNVVAINGASASARSKPAIFATGLTVQVPEYLEVGERVKINTQEARHISRE